MQQLQEEMNRVFERRYPDAGESGNVATSDWAPPVDIREEKDRFIILADLPGVEPAKIEVNMEHGVLSIKGERPAENAEQRAGYKRVERPRGTFYRRFSLPDTADAERVSASTRNGVLQVVIPKQERLQPRKIEVKS
jgi:HSP20 family protein